MCSRFHDNLEAYIEEDEQLLSKEAFLELVEGIFNLVVICYYQTLKGQRDLKLF